MKVGIISYYDYNQYIRATKKLKIFENWNKVWDEVFNLRPNWSLHEISKFDFLLKLIVMLAYAISLLTHVCGSALTWQVWLFPSIVVNRQPSSHQNWKYLAQLHFCNSTLNKISWYTVIDSAIPSLFYVVACCIN